MSIQEDSNNEIVDENVNENVQGEVHEETHEERNEEQTVKTQRSDPTKRELIAIAKKRAIDNFEKGIADPEYKVTKMTNGKYRCYKRKVDLPPEPVKQDQIPKNVRSSDSVNEKVVEKTDKIKDKPKNKDKQHDPFADIVYFNLNNQMNEQLNKRLDFLNHEIEKLHTKNTKLKGKYKQLKQAIYVTESDDEVVNEHDNEPSAPKETQPSAPEVTQPSTPTSTEPVTSPVIRRRTTGINFNQYFK